MTGVDDRILRVALAADFREEGWPSMDLVADMLEHHVPLASGRTVAIEVLRAPFARRFTWSADGAPRTVDRVVNRFWDYPRWLRARTDGFDVFHVADHSYAHLVHALPPERTAVFCHDADAFRTLVGADEGESLLPRQLTRRVLDGLRKAAAVMCISAATRDSLCRDSLVEPQRMHVVPLGVHPSCSPAPDPEADAAAERLCGEGSVDLLHVGSTIPRKRIDLLLEIVAAVRAARRDVRLVRVGGPFTQGQDAIAARLGLRGHVLQAPFLDRRVLAAVYRRAALVLLTSGREGFGLPLVEAMACGTPVVASDLPVLREVGGSATTYCPLGDVERWRDTVLGLLHEREGEVDAWADRRSRALRHAASYTWDATARASVAVYRQLAFGLPR